MDRRTGRHRGPHHPDLLPDQVGPLAPRRRAVGAYIGAAYWFTSSTSFANPAVTVGRIFSNSFAGIAPASVAGFIGAQIVGMAVGLGLIALFYLKVNEEASDARPETADIRSAASPDSEFIRLILAKKQIAHI